MKTKKSFLARNWHWGLIVGVLTVGLMTGAIPQADVLAASSDILDDADRPNAASNLSFRDAVRSILNYFLTFLGLICVIFIVYAGILMVTAGGDDEQTGKAKKILIWAAAGVVLVLLSFAIVRLFVGAVDQSG